MPRPEDYTYQYKSDIGDMVKLETLTATPTDTLIIFNNHVLEWLLNVAINKNRI